MAKEYFVFAGVNGAGKSTLYELYPHVPKERINSDEILREKGGDWRNSAAQADAMKEAVKRINEYFKKGKSFNQETTLTGRTIINNIKKAKEQGYTVKVCYVGLNSADLAFQRVNYRVSKGGHGIPEADVRRRYEQSMQNLKEIIPICDKIEIYDNTEDFACVASYKEGQLEFRKECEWLDKYIPKEKEVVQEKITAKNLDTMDMSSWENILSSPRKNVVEKNSLKVQVNEQESQRS